MARRRCGDAGRPQSGDRHDQAALAEMQPAHAGGCRGGGDFRLDQLDETSDGGVGVGELVGRSRTPSPADCRRRRHHCLARASRKVVAGQQLVSGFLRELVVGHDLYRASRVLRYTDHGAEVRQPTQGPMLGDPHPGLVAEHLGNKGSVESGDDSSSTTSACSSESTEVTSAIASARTCGRLPRCPRGSGQEARRSTPPRWGRCSASSTGEDPR